MSESRRLVDKLWSYCNVLRDDGVGVIEYTEQLTYLLFLKMAHERANRKLNPQLIVPSGFSWQRLLDAEGTELEVVYTEILVGLAQQPGTLGTIFRKAQNRIQDPAKLKRLIVYLIDKENWSASGTDLKGDAYEELLSKGASEKGSGAGQYFTPRDLIVDAIDPKPEDTVVDPAGGTGGFLLVTHEHAARGAESLTPTLRAHLRDTFASGYELVDGTARFAGVMSRSIWSYWWMSQLRLATAVAHSTSSGLGTAARLSLLAASPIFIINESPASWSSSSASYASRPASTICCALASQSRRWRNSFAVRRSITTTSLRPHNGNASRSTSSSRPGLRPP